MRIFILGGAGAMGSETTKDIVKMKDFQLSRWMQTTLMKSLRP
jgi:dihydrodipicolinate reductase